MLYDILRFNRRAPELLATDSSDVSLESYLDVNGYSREFVEHYVVPMGAAIWSAAPERP